MIEKDLQGFAVSLHRRTWMITSPYALTVESRMLVRRLEHSRSSPHEWNGASRLVCKATC